MLYAFVNKTRDDNLMLGMTEWLKTQCLKMKKLHYYRISHIDRMNPCSISSYTFMRPSSLINLRPCLSHKNHLGNDMHNWPSFFFFEDKHAVSESRVKSKEELDLVTMHENGWKQMKKYREIGVNKGWWEKAFKLFFMCFDIVLVKWPFIHPSW